MLIRFPGRTSRQPDPGCPADWPSARASASRHVAGSSLGAWTGGYAEATEANNMYVVYQDTGLHSREDGNSPVA